jgi:ketosteroid isomerase-like protein
MNEIEDFFENYKNAVWQKNATMLLKLYDTKVVSFDMWDIGHYKTRNDWAPSIESWLSSLGEEKVKVDFEMIKIFKSETNGFASGLIEFQAIDTQEKVLRKMKNRITVGFSKFKNGWKVVHQHISAPISSENLTAILDL